MFLKEYENVEVLLTHCSQPSKWEKSIGFKPIINEPFIVHWSLLKSKSKYRTKFIKVKCDDCNNICERKIRDLDPNKNYHLCGKCRKTGEKNGRYGVPCGEKQKESIKNWMLENGNPFSRNDVKIKIKNKEKERIEKIVSKTRGQKRSEDIKKKMSLSMINAVKTGRLKTWNNVKVKQYQNIDYQGTYELKFLKFVEEMGKLEMIERGPNIQYEIDGIIHNYFVDYKLKNTNIIFEIKSRYYWKKREDINILKKQEAEKEHDYYLVMDNNFKQIEKLFQ